MPFTIGQLLAGLVLPPVLIALGIALAWRPWRKDSSLEASRADVRWIFAPLAAAGFAVAYLAFEPRLAWPPTANVVYWLFYFAAAVAVLGLLDAALMPPLWLRTLILLILWRLALRLILINQIPRLISEAQAELWIDASSLVTICWWLAVETLAERSPGATVPLLLTLLSTVAALILSMAWHIQTSAALAGSLAAMSAAALVFCFWRSRIPFSRGLAHAIVLILQILLVHGYFYTDDALTSSQEAWFALFLASPLLAFIGDVPPLCRVRPSRKVFARVLPVAILLACIAGATIHDFVQAQQAQSTMEEP